MSPERDAVTGLDSQDDIDKEMRLISESYAAGGAVETQPRRDYEPYRSSLLRHPTKDHRGARPPRGELAMHLRAARLPDANTVFRIAREALADERRLDEHRADQQD